MFVTYSKHLEEQVKKRNPDKSIERARYKFLAILKAFQNKTTHKGNKVRRYNCPNKYEGLTFKLLYETKEYTEEFIYAKDLGEITLITYIRKGRRTYINGKAFNLDN